MRDRREVLQLLQHVPLLGVGRPPSAESGLLPQPGLGLSLVGGQPDGLVRSGARHLPSSSKVTPQPGSEDVDGRPLLDGALQQPAFNLLPRGRRS
eukprot:2812603-Alexandrium_andersonii.AAC.1